ncbi:MAG: hypothetical protein M3M91_09145 [Thermoproteota archaeon]|nr:hypothetical protein [Thermoproteota archaeon]
MDNLDNNNNNNIAIVDILTAGIDESMLNKQQMKQNQFSKVRVRVPEMIILTLTIGAVNVAAIVIISGNVLVAIEFF